MKWLLLILLVLAVLLVIGVVVAIAFMVKWAGQVDEDEQ